MAHLIPILSICSTYAIMNLLGQHLPTYDFLQNAMLVISSLSSWLAPLVMTALFNNECLGYWRTLWKPCGTSKQRQFDFYCNGILVANHTNICGTPARHNVGVCLQSMVQVMFQLLCLKMLSGAAISMFLMFATPLLPGIYARLTCQNSFDCSSPSDPNKIKLKASMKIQNALQIALIFGPFMPLLYLPCVLNMLANIMKAQASLPNMMLETLQVESDPCAVPVSLETETSTRSDLEESIAAGQLRMSVLLRAVFLLCFLPSTIGWEADLFFLAGALFAACLLFFPYHVRCCAWTVRQ